MVLPHAMELRSAVRRRLLLRVMVLPHAARVMILRWAARRRLLLRVLELPHAA